MYFDPTYWLFMLPALLATFLASQFVKRAYAKWSRVPVRSRMTGAEAAERLVTRAGLHGSVRLEVIPGNLNDHYDPRSKTLRLSNGVALSSSVAGLAVAAHELGHALQDAEGYFPLRLRSALVPAVNIGSNLGWILIFAGLFLNLTGLAWAGVVFFASGAVFALATLPVEFNASARARVLLRESGLIQTAEEEKGVNQVLTAAALTYVAALFTAVMQLLYFIGLVGGRSNRRS